MPVYEYRCEMCSCEFEKLHFSAPKRPVACPECDSFDVERKVSSFGTAGLEKQTSSGSGCGGCSKGTCSGCSCG